LLETDNLESRSKFNEKIRNQLHQLQGFLSPLIEREDDGPFETKSKLKYEKSPQLF
jgi:hypothetical protein